MGPELPCLEAADGELAAEDGAKQIQVGAVEQIEAAVAALPLVDGGGVFSGARSTGRL